MYENLMTTNWILLFFLQNFIFHAIWLNINRSCWNLFWYTVLPFSVVMSQFATAKTVFHTAKAFNCLMFKHNLQNAVKWNYTTFLSAKFHREMFSWNVCWSLIFHFFLNIHSHFSVCDVAPMKLKILDVNSKLTIRS